MSRLSDWRIDLAQDRHRLVERHRTGRRMERWARTVGLDEKDFRIMPAYRTLVWNSWADLAVPQRVGQVPSSLHEFGNRVRKVTALIGHPPDEVIPHMGDDGVDRLEATWEVDIAHVRNATVTVVLWSPKDCKIKPGTGKPRLDFSHFPPAEIHPQCAAALRELEDE